MEREYTISYKIYFNTRLKRVSFHGREVFPLYIRIIHNRKPIYFKSYYFDLLSKEKYVRQFIFGKKAPLLEEVIQKEEQLLNFLTQLPRNNVTPETFKEDYNCYSRDLLHCMEEGFNDYLITCFSDEGHPEMAFLVFQSREKMRSAELINGFRSGLKPQLFEKLLANAPYYGPPYLPLYAFASGLSGETVVTFSYHQWIVQEQGLKDYLEKEFSSYPFEAMSAYITSHCL